MARSMWTGVISFGMVTIPVKLFTATQSHNLAFHLLHEKCETRIKEQRWCPHCDKVVEWDDIVKGFEYRKGEYVELTEEDFDKLPLPSKHTIDLSSFVDAEEIDPILFDATYYVAIDEKGAQKAYKLLNQVMESKNVLGVATITFRNRERMCALRSIEGRLVLQTLLYEDELKENESSKPTSVQISAQEKKMAENLVTALHGAFDPGKFKDKYQAALKRLIQSKLKGTEIKEITRSEPTPVTDLMEALRASVEGTKSSGKARKKPASISAKAKEKSKTAASTKKTPARKTASKTKRKGAA